VVFTQEIFYSFLNIIHKIPQTEPFFINGEECNIFYFYFRLFIFLFKKTNRFVYI